jgi:hypothetical protein
MLTKPKRCPRLRAMLANETVEKPQIAQISIKKVLYLQQLFSQVQTFSTVSTNHCTVLPPAGGLE